MNRKIEFSPPDITDDEIAEVVDTLKSGWITTGPKTKKFEKEIAAYCHTKYAVCLNSATACLEMALRVLGVGEGDEVITSAYTYTASASVVCHVGAKLVLVDTQKDSFEMDYGQLEQAVNKNTKVIIPVDLAGIPCDYEKIYDIIERKKDLFQPSNEIQRTFGRIVVCADSAHAFGAERNGKKCGELADFTSFSFHAVKNLTTGEGGALTWREHEGIDSASIYHSLMLLTLHGQSKDALSKMKVGSWEYDIVAPYYKCNMTDIAASLGLAQIRRYADLLKKRSQLIESYDESLKDVSVEPLRHYTSEYRSSGHLYILRIKERSRNEINQIIKNLAEQGIATNVHYKPLPLLTAYKTLGFDIKDFPNAFSLYEHEITLPLHTLMSIDDAVYVAKSLKACADL